MAFLLLPFLLLLSPNVPASHTCSEEALSIRRRCDIRVLDRTHINNDIHYCDALQEEVDREGMCKTFEETEEYPNADDTIESEGGLLEGL